MRPPLAVFHPIASSLSRSPSDLTGRATRQVFCRHCAHNGKRVALHTASGVTYLHGDHLGSSSLTTNASGSIVSQLRYLPFGGTRWESGSTPTDFQFTGQRKEAGIGLYDYNARYYDPLLGRFVSADSVVPGAGKPQALNRYGYVFNNPLKYTDPSGHCAKEDKEDRAECYKRQNQIVKDFDVEMLGDWTLAELNDIRAALQALSDRIESRTFKNIWSKTTIVRDRGNAITCDACATKPDTVHFGDGFWNGAYDKNATIAHEFAHIWDQRKNDGDLWREMAKFTGSNWTNCQIRCTTTAAWNVGPGTTKPGGAVYPGTNGWEDWASAFEIWFSGNRTLAGIYYTREQYDSRMQFVQMKVDQARSDTNRPWWQFWR
jgi:RHS repeat-associated protein